MTMNDLRQAFYQVAREAQPARRSYVSLYAILPYFGGVEEGGWWGHDVELVAYQEVSSDVEAEAVADKVRELAEDLSKEAKDSFHRGAAAQMEWLEQHDPMADESDYFPEVDGAEEYYVVVESQPGSQAYQGSRYYE